MGMQYSTESVLESENCTMWIGFGGYGPLFIGPVRQIDGPVPYLPRIRDQSGFSNFSVVKLICSLLKTFPATFLKDLRKSFNVLEKYKEDV